MSLLFNDTWTTCKIDLEIKSMLLNIKNAIAMISEINSNKSSTEDLLIYLYHLGICKIS